MAGLLLSPAAKADPTDVEALLSEPIVTTVSKTPETERTAPATSTVLTGEEIHRYGLRTLAEAIDFLSLGAVTSERSGSPEIGARGVQIPDDNNDHFLLLIDGHAVNEPLSGGMEIGWGVGIPMEIVDHVEITLGPGSVVYGTGAMFGVINVVTKRAKDFAGVHVFADTSVVSNGRVGAGAGYEISLFGERAEVTAAVEYFAQKGPSILMPQENAGIDPVTGLPGRYSRFGPPTGIWGGRATQTNTAQAPTAYARFIVGHLEVSLNAAMFKRGLPESPGSFDDPLNREIDRRASLDAIYRIPISTMLDMSVRAYADLYDRDAQEVGLYSVCQEYCLQSNPGSARWAGTEVRAAFDWLGNGRLVTTLGVDARVRSVSAKQEQLDGPTGTSMVATGVYSQTDAPIAAYGQQTFQPVRWLFFNAGVRLDSDPRFTPVVSPRVAGGVTPWEGATFKAVYSQAFRSPSWDETNGASSTQLMTIGLVPESVKTVDVSFDQRFGAHRLRMGVFWEDWDNLVELHELSSAEEQAAFASGQLPGISHDPTIPLTQFRNEGNIVSVGANLGYDGTFGPLRLAANLTSARATDPDSPAPLALAPQFFGNARASYDLGDRWPVVALAVRYIGRRIADTADSSGFAPIPTVSPQAEVRGTVTGAVPGVRGLSFRTSASYIFGSAEPYVIGPVQHPVDTSPNPGLLPIVERSRVLVGLQYDF
jgi:outer membrane receptor for ferrienterochelin and colicins